MCVLSPHVSALLLLAEARGAVYDPSGTRYEGGVDPDSGDNPQAFYQQGRVMG